MITLFFLVSLSGPALAAPSAADRATARALAAEGHQALQRQDFEAAEDRFRRADALIHAPTLVVDHARALVGLGRLAEAYERYDSVIREGVTPDAPWAFQRALQNATQELEALKPKLAWLTLVVKGPTESEVTIDGHAVPPAAAGTRRAIDPGSRSIRVTAPGFQQKEVQIELVPGQNEELELELEEAVAAPEAETLPEAPTVAPRPPSRETPDRDHTLAYVALGVGGAGLATGIVTGVIALGTRSSILSACPELKCTPETEDERRKYQKDAKRYRTLGTVSGIGFGLGLAGAAAGIALLLIDQADAHAEKSTASLVPVVGPGAVGVRGSF